MNEIVKALIVYGLGLIQGFFFTWIAFLLAGKNARTFFFNELFRRSTVFNIIGRKLRVMSGKIKGNLVETSVGDFIINPKSVYYSNNQVFFTYSNLGANLDLKQVKATEKLSEKGIKDYEQAEAINSLLKAEGKELVTEINTKEAISFDEIENFFKYNINADYVRSVIEHEVASRINTRLIDVFKWIVLVLAIAGVIFVAYIIIQDNNKVPISVCQQLAQATKQQLINHSINQTANVIAMR